MKPAIALALAVVAITAAVFSAAEVRSIAVTTQRDHWHSTVKRIHEKPSRKTDGTIIRSPMFGPDWIGRGDSRTYLGLAAASTVAAILLSIVAVRRVGRERPWARRRYLIILIVAVLSAGGVAAYLESQRDEYYMEVVDEHIARDHSRASRNVDMHAVRHTITYRGYVTLAGPWVSSARKAAAGERLEALYQVFREQLKGKEGWKEDELDELDRHMGFAKVFAWEG